MSKIMTHKNVENLPYNVISRVNFMMEVNKFVPIGYRSLVKTIPRSVVDVLNFFGGNLDFPRVKNLKKVFLMSEPAHQPKC